MLRRDRVGGALLGSALACFGAHDLLFAMGVIQAAPGPPWVPGAAWSSTAAGAGLLVGGVGLLLRWRAPWPALLVAIALVARVLVVHVPLVLVNVRAPGPWTSAGEILSIAGGALSLAAPAGGGARPWALTWARSRVVAPVLFAMPLFVFGAQHLMYGRFVATLVPAWIPARLFWAYFVGAAFLAAACAILARRAAGLASLLLGLMFLSWVLVVHLPRVVASPHFGNGWTSMFVALAMSGAALAAGSAVGPWPRARA